MGLTEREKRIYDLYRQGMSLTQIAALEGLHWVAVKIAVIKARSKQYGWLPPRRKRRRRKRPAPPPPSPRWAVVRQRRSELYRQGFVQREIGAVEGVTRQAVSAMNLKIMIGRADRGTLPVGFLERSGLSGCGFCELCGQTAVKGQRRCAEHPANGVEPITVMLEPPAPRPPSIENVWHERRTMRLAERRQREETAAAERESVRERRRAAAEAWIAKIGSSFRALKSEGEIRKWTDKRCSTGPGTTM